MSKTYGMIIMDVRPETEDHGQIVQRIYRWSNGYGVSVLTDGEQVSRLAVVKWFDNGSYEFVPVATPATNGELMLSGLGFDDVAQIMGRVQELEDTVLAINWALAEEAKDDS